MRKRAQVATRVVEADELELAVIGPSEEATHFALVGLGDPAGFEPPEFWQGPWRDGDCAALYVPLGTSVRIDSL